MTLTFDISRLEARMAAARAALVPAAVSVLPDAAMMAIETSGYNAAGFEEENAVDAATLITDVEQSGSVLKIGIIQLWDWQLSPDSHHCQAGSNGGINCPDLAAGGPYKESEFSIRPRDGSTPCDQNCNCEFLPRDPIPESDVQAALALAGGVVRVELAGAWGSA